MSYYETDSSLNIKELNSLPFPSFEGSFLAGGALKNILCHEKVRDYDVYFRDEKSFNNALKKVQKHVKQGSAKFIYENEKVYAVKYENMPVVELIRYKFGTPVEIVSDFDFTIAQAWFDKENQEFGYNSDFFKHLHQKRLVLNSRLLLPINTWERVLKYTGYGYTLCSGGKIQLLQAIARWFAENNLRDNDSSSYSELEKVLSRSLYNGLD